MVGMEEVVEVEDKDQQAPASNTTLADVIREIRCVVCGSDMDENIMLLCDQCDKGFHTTCIDLAHIPNLELWYCQQCIVDMAPEVQELQLQEMQLAAIRPAANTQSSTKSRKRIRRGADFTPRVVRPNFALRDFPAGYFETCDATFDLVARSLTSRDF